MGKTNWNGFRCVRARVQSYASGKILNGWVEEIQEGWIALRLGIEIYVPPGEKLLIEVHGIRNRLIVDGVAIPAHSNQSDPERQKALARLGRGVVGNIVELRMSSAPKITPATEPFRKRVDGHEVEFELGGSQVVAAVVDISESGMGLESTIQIAVGTQIALRYSGHTSFVHLIGTVRSCRPSLETPKCFRIGLEVEPASRVESGRWAALFDVSQAA